MLAADFSQLRAHVSQVIEGGADWLHLDVMDGAFVPNISYGPPVITAMRPHVSLPFDTHLMVQEPERFIDDYRKAGCDMITVHQEACSDVRRTLRRITESGARAGVAINPPTPATAVLDLLSEVSLVLVMTVHAGFGGQAFMPEVLSKVSEVRKASSGMAHPPRIEVDGGIDAANARRCVEAGADVLVAGTSVFRTNDPAGAVRTLRRNATGGELS